MSPRQAQAVQQVHPIETTKQDIGQRSKGMTNDKLSQACSAPEATKFPLTPALHSKKKEKKNKQQHTHKQSWRAERAMVRKVESMMSPKIQR